MRTEPLARAFVRHNTGATQTLEFFPGTLVTIGRAPDNTVYVTDETISRRHAELSANHLGVHFRNLGRNGSIVNRKKVSAKDPLSLNDGAELVIGSCAMQIELLQEEETRVGERTMLFVPQDAKAERTMIFTRTVEPQAAPHPHARMQKPEAKKESEAAPAGAHRFISKLRAWQAQHLKSPVTKVGVVLIPLLFIWSLMLPSPQAESRSITQAVRNDKTSKAKSVNLPQDEAPGPVPAAALRAAQILFDSAQKLFEERKLRQRNLYDSICKWSEGLNLLQLYTERPAEFEEAFAKKELAEAELQQQFEDWKKDVLFYFRKREFKKAEAVANGILAAIPKVEDERHRWAADYSRRSALALNKRK